MHYEIKAFDKASGSALVRFWTDDYPDGLAYNIDIPIAGGAYLAGEALAAHIMSFAPHGQIARLVAAAAVDTSAIEALLPPAPPPQVKTTAQLKAERLAHINRTCDAVLGELKAGYPGGEVLSWSKQEAEARAFAADAAAATPLLDALAAAREITKADLAARVIVKADAFAALSGALIGKRQKLEDQLDALPADATPEQILAIAW